MCEELKVCSLCKTPKLKSEFGTYTKKSKKEPNIIFTYLKSRCKECEKLKTSEWKRTPKGKVYCKKYIAEYHKNNPGKKKKSQDKYRVKNDNKLKKYNKEYRENNKESIKAIKYLWVENNKEKVQEYRNKYVNNNKEKIHISRLYGKSYAANLLGGKVKDFSSELIEAKRVHLQLKREIRKFNQIN